GRRRAASAGPTAPEIPLVGLPPVERGNGWTKKPAPESGLKGRRPGREARWAGLFLRLDSRHRDRWRAGARRRSRRGLARGGGRRRRRAILVHLGHHL